MRKVVVCMLLSLVCVALAAAQEQRVEIYRVRHRVAEELAPMVKAIIKDTGSVTVDSRTNSLILAAPGGRMDLALQILAEQDAPPRTVLVQYRGVRSLEMESAGIQVQWAVGTGDVRIGNLGPPPQSNAAAAALHADWTAEHGTFTGMLRLLEGATGRIHAGTAEPIRTGRLQGTAGYVVTASGFQVTARVLGSGKVRLDLAPVNAAVVPGGSIRFSAAVSTVEVTSGETVILGHLQRDGTSTGAGTAGVRRTESSEEELLLVRVQVE